LTVTYNHELKCWPAPFSAIRRGAKHHEVRKTTDRHFCEGQRLLLREWNPITKEYTGQTEAVRVSYVSVPGSWGLPDDTAVLSIERIF
jgi:hypothetical protein